MKKNSTMNNIPQLRFPGYTGEWEEKSLGEVGVFVRGLSYNKEEVTQDSASTLVIRSNNIIQDGTVDCRNGLQFVTKVPSSEQVLQKGDIVICLSNGSSNLVGKSANYEGDHDGIATVGAFCGIYRSTAPITKYLVQTPSYKKSVELIKQGGNGALANLYGRDILGLKFYFPSLEEQNEIVECLEAEDKMIAAQEQKVEFLKAHKKGLMQQLFPQAGETIPRLRFPGFEGEWEERTLGEIGDTFSGLTGKSKEDFENGNSKFITFMNVLKNVRIDTSILGTVNVGDCERQNTVENGDMLFNTSSETPEEVGFCSVYDSDIQENVYLNSFCFGYRFKEKTNYYPLFLAYYLRSVYGRSLMNRLAQGITRFNLSKEYFNKAIIPFPTFNEQQKIAECLSSLDQVISAEEKELEALKVHKKGLMQQLFPQFEK